MDKYKDKFKYDLFLNKNFSSDSLELWLSLVSFSFVIHLIIFSSIVWLLTKPLTIKDINSEIIPIEMIEVNSNLDNLESTESFENINSNSSISSLPKIENLPLENPQNNNEIVTTPTSTPTPTPTPTPTSTPTPTPTPAPTPTSTPTPTPTPAPTPTPTPTSTPTATPTSTSTPTATPTATPTTNTTITGEFTAQVSQINSASNKDIPSQLAQIRTNNRSLASINYLTPLGITLNEEIVLKTIIIIEIDGSVDVLSEFTEVLQGTIDKETAGKLAQSILEDWEFEPSYNGDEVVAHDYSIILTTSPL